MKPSECTILIIDDEPFLRSTLGLILRRVGYNFHEASCAQDALTLATQNDYSLIFLDLQLPDREGLEILPELRSLLPRTPVIVLTANGSLEKAVEAMRRGAHEYLLKPVDPGQIVTLVDDILREQANGIDSKSKDIVPATASLEEPTALVSRGDLSLDFQNHSLTYRGKRISLPPCTFEYLVTLMRHAPHAVSYQELVRQSQGYVLTPIEAQDLARWRIYRLRKALEENPNDPRLIITVPGTGFKLLLH